MIDTRRDNRRVIVTTAGRAAAMVSAMQAGEQVAELAEQRLENPVPGDVMKSDDGQVKYHIEHHANGRHTFHREHPKLSKAEKKRAKRARRRG